MKMYGNEIYFVLFARSKNDKISVSNFIRVLQIITRAFVFFSSAFCFFPIRTRMPNSIMVNKNRARVRKHHVNVATPTARKEKKIVIIKIQKKNKER